MCGRIACTLCKIDVQQAAREYSKNNEPPKWIEKYESQAYEPSYNVSPTQILPVLVKEHLIDSAEQGESLVICPMRWGLIPFWFKGSSVTELRSLNHNCRIESVLMKPTFKAPMVTGKRCVILADGYYEWVSSGSSGKVPYFIHFKNESGIQMHERAFEKEKFHVEDGVWKGPRLLTLAGIFDIWKSSKGTAVCSCSILTMESSKVVSKIHHRMPVILDGVDAVRSWLDCEKGSCEEAIAGLKPVENLKFYQVKPVVNNSRNNVVECIKPVNDAGAVSRSKEKKSSKIHNQMTLEHMFEMSSKKIKLDCPETSSHEAECPETSSHEAECPETSSREAECPGTSSRLYECPGTSSRLSECPGTSTTILAPSMAEAQPDLYIVYENLKDNPRVEEAWNSIKRHVKPDQYDEVVKTVNMMMQYTRENYDTYLNSMEAENERTDDQCTSSE